MRVYTVHLKDADTAPDRDRNMVLVKEGFCWPVVFLSFLWAAWHRMWVAAAVMAVVFAGSGFVMGMLRADYATSFIVHGLLGIALGFAGNGLRRWHLGRRGYCAAGGVAGANMDEAEERYFRERGVPSQLTGAGA